MSTAGIGGFLAQSTATWNDRVMWRRLAIAGWMALSVGCARPPTFASVGDGTVETAPSAPATPPAAGEPRTAMAIAFAEAQVGKRYCWGGTGPDCFDCSGLVQSAWHYAGIALPRTAGAQGRALVDVPIDQVRPGDILWWPTHVGLYIGGGQMIDAYHSRAGVVRRPLAVPRRVLRVDVHAPPGLVASARRAEY